MISVKVGLASCGIASGAKEVFNELKKRKIKTGIVGCIGACYAEPLIEVKKDDEQTIIFQKVLPEDIDDIIDSVKKGKTHKKVFAKRDDGKTSKIKAVFVDDHEFYKNQTKRVSSLCGIIDPENINDYIENRGYEALKKVSEMKQEEIVSEVIDSNLRGRGGAGFPTGKKWQFLNKKDKTRYLICNFDEGDPGAFMNRVLVESNPHQLVEGIAISAYALGAKKAFVYTRAEYPLAVKRLKSAIQAAKQKKFIGKHSKINVDIEVRLGAGAYVCGEETALIASIEGEAGRPRNKPPFPAVKGLFGKPTIINNVETLSNIPLIIKNGSRWFKNKGSKTSSGTKMFSFSGMTSYGGYIEVELGTSVEKFLDIAGVEKEKVKGLHIGGPSGGTISMNFNKLNVDYDNVKQADAIMGSGSMVIIPESQDMVQLAKFFLEFSVSESCGKCVPCREGNVKLLSIINKILDKKANTQDLVELEKLALTIRDSAFCGLGKAAPNPVISTIKHFRSDYTKYLAKGRLKPDETYVINEEKCVGCHLCASNCPANAIVGSKFEIHRINQKECIRCGKCYDSCKIKAIDIQKVEEPLK